MKKQQGCCTEGFIWLLCGKQQDQWEGTGAAGMGTGQRSGAAAGHGNVPLDRRTGGHGATTSHGKGHRLPHPPAQFVPFTPNPIHSLPSPALWQCHERNGEPGSLSAGPGCSRGSLQVPRVPAAPCSCPFPQAGAFLMVSHHPASRIRPVLLQDLTWVLCAAAPGSAENLSLLLAAPQV